MCKLHGKIHRKNRCGEIWSPLGKSHFGIRGHDWMYHTLRFLHLAQEQFYSGKAHDWHNSGLVNTDSTHTSNAIFLRWSWLCASLRHLQKQLALSTRSSLPSIRSWMQKCHLQWGLCTQQLSQTLHSEEMRNTHLEVDLSMMIIKQPWTQFLVQMHGRHTNMNQ